MKPYVWNPWRTAETLPDRTAVIADGEYYTFADITAHADALGRGLQAAGLADGAVVSTDIPTGPRFFALALAALRYGYGLFPADTSLFASGVGARLQDDMATALHITSGDAPGGGASPCPSVTDDDLLRAAAPASTVAAVAPRAGHLAFATSGTTGEPQAVPRARPARPYRGVAVLGRYAAGASFGPHVMGNPAYHLGTLGPALYALQAGSTVVVQRSWSPAGFAELVDRHRADSAFLSLDLLVDVVESGQAPARPLRALFHGGAACPPALKRSAIELLGPVLHEYYGTSRSTVTEITADEWLRHPGSVGRPLPGIGVVIRRGGRTLGPREPGEIWLRLRVVDRAPGQPELLPTGDLGYLDEDGYLFVVGRESGGQAGGADMAYLEHQIRLLPGIADVAVTGDTVPVCYVETLPGLPERTLRDIATAAERLGMPGPDLRPAPAGTLPRTPSGKIRRAALDAWWTTARPCPA
ncbi:class I adenylate-forming enzyme family protein [Streptomyces sp. NPDC058683]|uniref:class I adenylate-forming enzyme family protein n=1 Tax=Streptomyces sp. NPDC058683 TaxID=3346597 RepID=UPI003669711A